MTATLKYILQGPMGSVLPLNPNIKELGLNFYFVYHVIHTIVIHTSVNRIRRPSSVHNFKRLFL